MRGVMKTKRYLAIMLLAAACADDPGAGDPADPIEDEAPLGSYEGIVGGAPKNDSLPDENKADAVYPSTFSELVAVQSPVKSQGSRGVCSIFATAALMESLYIKAGQPNPDFSEQFLQWSVKNEVGAYRNTSGSNAAENLEAIADFGIPAESAWPYEAQQWSAPAHPQCAGDEKNFPTECFTNGEPPQTAMAAPRLRLPQGRWLNTNSMKAHLTTKKTGVQVGFDFFYQAWNHRRSTLPVNAEAWSKGYVLAPNADDVTESHKQRAGHSVLIVGWDDTLEVPIVDKDGKQVLGANGKPKTEKGFWIFKNSWGTTGFGIQNPYGAGYGFLSMKYVASYGSAYVTDAPQLGSPTGSDHFEAAPALAIPDGSAAGIASTITLPAGAAIGTLQVTVDISHGYIGDLTVSLAHSGKVVTLHQQSGGSAKDLKKTFTVPAFTGADRAGAWTLKVVDNATDDTGRLNSWAIDLK